MGVWVGVGGKATPLCTYWRVIGECLCMAIPKLHACFKLGGACMRACVCACFKLGGACVHACVRPVFRWASLFDVL